jgi:hypothetical protein
LACKQVGPMPGISYDTAFEVVLSTGFTLHHILGRAYLEDEPLPSHLSSGCVGVESCVFFHRCATKGSPWIYCYIKQYFILGRDIFAVSVY